MQQGVLAGQRQHYSGKMWVGNNVQLRSGTICSSIHALHTAAACSKGPRTVALVEEAGAEACCLGVGRGEPPRKSSLCIPPSRIYVVKYLLRQVVVGTAWEEGAKRL